MAMLEVKSAPNLLGTPVSYAYAYAVKAGPWIFLTGHEAFDLESGIPEEVAGPSGFPLFGRPRSRREGDFILQRMRRILREFGSDLGNGVPDGICIDAHGAVWYADVPNKRCVRVREGGDVLQTVNADRGCFACMLGGPHRRTLFIVATEWRGMEKAAEVVLERTGQLLTIEARTPGVRWP